MCFYGARQRDPNRPLFDVTFLGVGEDGHTASLFPGSPLRHEQSCWVAAVAHEVPEACESLTYPAPESSRHVAVTGAPKRTTMQAICAGADALLAARLQANGHTHWLVGRAAAPEHAP